MSQISLSISILRKQITTSTDTNSHVSGIAEYYHYDNNEKDLVPKPIEFRASGVTASAIAAMPEFTFGVAVGMLEIVNRNLNKIPVINITGFLPADLDYLLKISGVEEEKEITEETVPESGITFYDTEYVEEVPY